jgi:hypothetical protein
MGKRTSDFMALAAIVGGAGLGLGMTSLGESQADRVPQADASSVRVEVLRRSIVVRPSRIDAGQVEELKLQTLEMVDIEALLETLEGVETLEDLELLEGMEALEDLGVLRNLTIDILGDDEAQRRKRRKRRPGREAEVPNSDGSEN